MSRPHSPVSIEELLATVARMEARLSALQEPAVKELWRVYMELGPRFEKDLGASARDVALAKASALMILQGVAHVKTHMPDGCAGDDMPRALFMVIENFKNNDAIPVYRRFKERGRLAPEGLNYISSWVDHNLTRCYQVMETPDRGLLDQWIANWSDLIDFEVHRVITSKDAAQKVGRSL